MSAPVAAPAAPAHSVTLPTGAVITSDMTPLERYNINAKSMGAPEVARPQGPQFGPGGMTPATAAEFARREAAFNKSGVPAADADDRARQAAHDAEVAKAKAPPASATTVVDQQLVEALHAAYRALPADQRSKRTELYQRELAEAYEGRRFGETRAAFTARINGTAPAAPAEGNGEWIPIAQVDSAQLSGYVLPKLTEGQQYHKSIYSQLADAKAAGVSQQQVTSYIEQQMKRDGWLK